MSKHDKYLEELVYNLKEIDENPKDIAWIMKDGIWTIEKGNARIKMPDLILCYYPMNSRKYSLVELKGSRHKKDHAKLQLASGEEFVRNFFNAEDITKKFVVYDKGGYDFEIIR